MSSEACELAWLYSRPLHRDALGSRRKFPFLGLGTVQAHICSLGIVLTFVSITIVERHRPAVFMVF